MTTIAFPRRPAHAPRACASCGIRSARLTWAWHRLCPLLLASAALPYRAAHRARGSAVSEIGNEIARVLTTDTDNEERRGLGHSPQIAPCRNKATAPPAKCLRPDNQNAVPHRPIYRNHKGHRCEEPLKELGALRRG